MDILPHHGSETLLLIDIASDQVTASLVAFSPNQPVHLLYSHREEIALLHDQDAPRLVGNTLVALRAAILTAQKEGHYKAKKICCFLSSPWHVSQTRIIHVEKMSPMAITQKMIMALVDQEKKKVADSIHAGEDYKGEEANKPGEALQPETLQLIESKIVSIKLNGYETEKPYGKSAKSIEISFFVSLAGKDFISKIMEVIHQVFVGATLEFHTFPIAAFSAVRDLGADIANDTANGKDKSSSLRNFLLLDIAGEVTDIAIMKHGVLLQSLTLPIGKNFFIRGLSKRLRVSYQVALSLFQLHAQGKCDPATDDKLEDELKKESVEWQACFHKALVELTQESFVPSKVFLTSDEELLPFFSDMVTAQDFSQFSIEKISFEPVAISPEHLKGFYRTSTTAKRMTPVLLESLFIHKIRNAA